MEQSTVQPKLKLDHFHVNRNSKPDVEYETKRIAMNGLRILGHLAYKGVLVLDRAVEASKQT